MHRDVTGATGGLAARHTTTGDHVLAAIAFVMAAAILVLLVGALVVKATGG